MKHQGIIMFALFVVCVTIHGADNKKLSRKQKKQETEQQKFEREYVSPQAADHCKLPKEVQEIFNASSEDLLKKPENQPLVDFMKKLCAQDIHELGRYTSVSLLLLGVQRKTRGIKNTRKN